MANDLDEDDVVLSMVEEMGVQEATAFLFSADPTSLREIYSVHREEDDEVIGGVIVVRDPELFMRLREAIREAEDDAMENFLRFANPDDDEMGEA
jgi:hypothetical protein